MGWTLGGESDGVGVCSGDHVRRSHVLDRRVLETTITDPVTPSVGEVDKLDGGELNYDDLMMLEEGNMMQDEYVGAEYEQHGGVQGEVMVKGDENDISGVQYGESEVVCTFNKRGTCMNHKIKGNAIKQKNRSWKKKKFGYGWVTTTVTTYTCSMASMQPRTSVAIGDIILSQSPESACSKGALILTEPGTEPRISRDTIGGMVGQD